MSQSIVDMRHGLREAFKWINIWRLLVAILIISVFISLVFGDFEKPDRHIWLTVKFVFTFLIALSIYLFLNMLRLDRVKGRWQRIALAGFAIVASGWIGNAVAIGVLYVSLKVTFSYTLRWFITNSGLILFFGTASYGYFVLRERLQIAVARLAEKEVNEQRMLRLQVKAELEALRARVNPHFLFNTLNSIASLIAVDPPKAEDIVQKLSHLLRHTLEASRSDLMTLDEELKIIREYLDIERTRLGERLSYSITMNKQLADTYIPGMLLQPLVENSVKHGIAPLPEGGRISILCSRSDKFCDIEIQDNGAGLPSGGPKPGFGISGVRERLALHYGKEAQFKIAADQGVCVTIRLPLKSAAGKANRHRAKSAAKNQ